MTTSSTLEIQSGSLDFSRGTYITTMPAGTTTSSFTANPVGTLVLYKDVFVAADGTRVDALVMLDEVSSNASVTRFDSDRLQYPNAAFFQPNVVIKGTTDTPGGFAKFHFQFIKGGSFTATGTIDPATVKMVALANPGYPGEEELQINDQTPYEKLTLAGISFSAYDIDGNSGGGSFSTARQFVETQRYEPGSPTVFGTATQPSDVSIVYPSGTENVGPVRFVSTDGNDNTASPDTPEGARHTGNVRLGPIRDFDLTVGDTSVTTTYTSLFGIEFGRTPNARIGDRLWSDDNGNGLQDAGESGIAGRTVSLRSGGIDRVLGTADDALSTAVTDASGNYAFQNLTPGVEYQVVFGDIPAGSVFTSRDVQNNASDELDSDADPATGSTKVITLTGGEINNTVDAGVYTPAGLSGTVYEDFNNDGIRTGDEPAIAGVSLTLTGVDGAGNSLTPITTTTDANGRYSFSGLRPGTYAVSQAQPAGFVDGRDTAGSSGGSNAVNDVLSGIVLTSGASSTDNNFGELRPASIGDFVWEDSNGDGLQDPGEAGLAGVTVHLRNGDNAVIATTTTDPNGRYSFGGLLPGTYSVSFLTPNGYVVTRRGTGSDETRDSDPAADGSTTAIRLGYGETNNTRDAGFTRAASLGDRVWSDNNANGIQDAGEQGIAGVSVNLLNAGNTVLATTTTNASGLYSFNGLAAGSYAVEFVRPAGTTFTSRSQGGNASLDSDADTSTGRSGLISLGAGESNTSLDAGLVFTAFSRKAPGVRTPGFWVNKNNKWQQFWDGNATNQNSLSQNGTATFPNGDLLFAPYTNSAQPGRVQDPVTGTYSTGILAGDFNRNGITDSGEDTIFYTTSEALNILNPSSNPDKNDIRYTLARDIVASWLNYVAGNPIDTAAPTDKDARYYIREGINWLQALTPDENNDRKGDGSLSGLSAVSSPALASGASAWNNSFSSPAGLPLPYSGNTSVSYLGGIDAGNAIHTALDDYNNGRGYADGVFYGGNP